MLTTTIPAYLYQQYADDDNLQGFVAAYNAAVQTYLDWFVNVGLPYYPGLTGDLLNWVAQGLYGLSKTSLQSQTTATDGQLNTETFNSTSPQGMLNSFVPSSSVFFGLNDDLFQRILTWDFYKADGSHFSMRWLKRRIMRFLTGTNGVDQLPTQPGFVIGAENTSAIGVQVAPVAGVLTLTVTINQSLLSSQVTLVPGIVNLFQLAFLEGALELPLQYQYAVVITNPLIVVLTPAILNWTANSPLITTAPVVSQVIGGGGPYTFAWTWKSGGTGITINTPSAASTSFSTLSLGSGKTVTGVALLTVNDSLGRSATAFVSVSITNTSSGALSRLVPNTTPLNTVVL